MQKKVELSMSLRIPRTCTMMCRLCSGSHPIKRHGVVKRIAEVDNTTEGVEVEVGKAPGWAAVSLVLLSLARRTGIVPIISHSVFVCFFRPGGSVSLRSHLAVCLSKTTSLPLTPDPDAPNFSIRILAWNG